MRRLMVAAAAAVLLASQPGLALAVDSGGHPDVTGETTIAWIGQGATGGSLDNEVCTDAAGAPTGPYLLWILTTDRGEIATDPGPILSLNGGPGTTAVAHDGHSWHFVTPYVAPDAGLTAEVAMTVTSVGSGQAWNLTIGEGCPRDGPPTPPVGDPPLTIAVTAAGSYDTTYAWTIEKSASEETTYTAGGSDGTVGYTVTVGHDDGTVSNVAVTGTATVNNPNTGAAVINGVTVSVSDGTTVTACTVTDGGSQTVQSGDTAFGFDCALSGLPEGTLTVIGVVDWDTQTLPPPDDGELAGGLAEGSSTVDFTESVIDECVDVSDSVAGSLGTVCVGDTNPTIFTDDGTVSGPAGTCTANPNTASYTAQDSGASDSAEASVLDCQGADLTLTKTATPGFTRTYGWSIDKSVDRTLVEQFGGTTTFNYGVTVEQTGFTDSAWVVSGTIEIHNPNDWESVTLTGVTDTIDNGGVCTVYGDTAQEISAGGDATGLSYICTYATAPDPTSGTNTATATWDAGTASTPTGTASGTATFAFGAPTVLVDGTVHATDTYAGALGTVTATDTEPFASAEFTYSRTIPIPTWNCLTYDNAAMITETGQTDGVTVTVCGPAKTGALTIGSWSNKNGQGIITSGASVGGVCSSGTWLRGFLPFGDLSASATCAQVATYVKNVITAANASGASMNKMLKGQMLATALDVYLSDPALGGNRIGAPAPIGGISVDLTKICTDLSCTAFEDSSPVFGGSPGTVLQMLAAAAAQSNSGGSTWYGNAKVTQELAKDAFDALNNQKVFVPCPEP